MADNRVYPLTGTGDATANIRAIEKAAALTQVIALDLAGSGAESLLSGTNPLPMRLRSTTGTQSTVAGSAANVTLVASNANRLGATIFNDSTAILYIKLGATASTSSYSFKAQPDDYYEVPFGYTGIVDGIWASATGNARITELT